MYMSNHPDTLVSYAKHWGKVKEHVVTAQMTAIDTKVWLSIHSRTLTRSHESYLELHIGNDANIYYECI